MCDDDTSDTSSELLPPLHAPLRQRWTPKEVPVTVMTDEPHVPLAHWPRNTISSPVEHVPSTQNTRSSANATDSAMPSAPTTDAVLVVTGVPRFCGATFLFAMTSHPALEAPPFATAITGVPPGGALTAIPAAITIPATTPRETTAPRRSTMTDF